MNHQLLMYMFDESISFLHIFGGFFLPAAHEFLMNAERNTHENAKKYTKWNADEKNGEEECKLIRRVRNIFVHEKPSGGEEEEEAALSLETRDTGRWRSLFRFWSISLSEFFRKLAWTRCDRQNLSLRLKDFSRLATRLGDNFNQLAYIFLQSTHIKKRVNKAVGGGEDEEDNFRKRAALHNSKISSRIHLSFPRHRRANFFWSSAASFIFGSLVINIA